MNFFDKLDPNILIVVGLFVFIMVYFGRAAAC